MLVGGPLLSNARGFHRGHQFLTLRRQLLNLLDQPQPESFVVRQALFQGSDLIGEGGCMSLCGGRLGVSSFSVQ